MQFELEYYESLSSPSRLLSSTAVVVIIVFTVVVIFLFVVRHSFDQHRAGALFQLFLRGQNFYFLIFNATGLLKNWKKTTALYVVI